VPTPHISAAPGDFAETVLLPGDPLRAKHIADTFLDDAVEVTAVRNMLGFTGTYKGTRVSVMGTGMGIPSASIYATELINEYKVKNLIRVGTCGAVQRDLGLHDVILAMGACTDSGVNRARFDGIDFAAIADWGLLRAAADAAERTGTPVRVGNVCSSDLFYHPDPGRVATLERMGVLAVEMEAAGLYGVAAEHGGKAMTIATVSDHILTHQETTSDERQTAFTTMMEIALETALAVA
jgi:purine-nucleoside phosphorylase